MATTIVPEKPTITSAPSVTPTTSVPTTGLAAASTSPIAPNTQPDAAGLTPGLSGVDTLFGPNTNPQTGNAAPNAQTVDPQKALIDTLSMGVVDQPDMPDESTAGNNADTATPAASGTSATTTSSAADNDHDGPFSSVPVLGAIIQRTRHSFQHLRTWTGQKASEAEANYAYARAEVRGAISGVQHYVSSRAQEMENFLMEKVLKPGDVVVWTGAVQHIATVGKDGKLHCEVPQNSMFSWRHNSDAAAADHFVVMRPPAGANIDGMLSSLASNSAGHYNHRCAHYFQVAARRNGFLPANFAQPGNAREYPPRLSGLGYQTVAEFKGGALVSGNQQAVAAASEHKGMGGLASTGHNTQVASAGGARHLHGRHPGPA